MGPMYSIRSGRDDSIGFYAGSGGNLAAWAGGIYLSCAETECRCVAQSTRSASVDCRHANRRITDARAGTSVHRRIADVA
jgi:hypothetical protein